MMNRKTVLLSAIPIVILTIAIVYIGTNNLALTSQYNNLQTENQKIINDYVELSKLIEQLGTDHQAVVDQYNGLVEEHNEVIAEFKELVDLVQVRNPKGHTSITTSVHCRIRIWNQRLTADQFDLITPILDEYHAGAVTNLGDNMTLYKWFGDTDWQYGSLSQNANVSWISIGNQGTLTTASTQLPGEWNRTTLTVEDEAQSQGNFTCTIYPDANGPYTADCLGLNCEASGDGNLVMYDTFTESSGIDENYTVNIELQVAYSHT